MGKRDKGFTLIELLVSMIILGVVVATMIPVIVGALSMGSDVGLMQYQTDTEVWYREIAKSKAMYKQVLSNETQETAVGDIQLFYTSKYIANRKYIQVTSSIAGWGVSSYVAPLRAQGVTTTGIYIQIITPKNGTTVGNHSELTIKIRAFYIQNNTTMDVDTVQIIVNNRNACTPVQDTNDSTLYFCSYVVNTTDDSLTIKAIAQKGEEQGVATSVVYVQETSYVVIKIISPPDQADVLPGRLRVEVDSYVQEGMQKTPVKPQVIIGNQQCSFIMGPTGVDGVTYIFECSIPSAYDTYEDIVASVSYNHTTYVDGIRIHIVGYITIVDVVNNLDSAIDEELPPCLNREEKYVVVKVDRGVVNYWQYIRAIYSYKGKIFENYATNLVNKDTETFYVYIPINEQLKSIWLPGNNVLITVSLNYNGVFLEDEKNITLCCSGVFTVTSSLLKESNLIQEFTTGTITTILTATAPEYGGEHDLCGLWANSTRLLKQRGLIIPHSWVWEMKIEKFNTADDQVHVGHFVCVDCQNNQWKYQTVVNTVNTATADVYIAYLNRDNYNQTSQNVSHTEKEGYNYVDMIYYRSSWWGSRRIALNSDEFEVYQKIGNNTETPYCQWQQEGENAYRAVRLFTSQKYTIKYKDDMQYTDILGFKPDTLCNYRLQKLAIHLKFDNHLRFYGSTCDNFPQVVTTLYVSNNTNRFAPLYIIDIFKSQRYQGRWGYTIFDNNCNEIVTRYIPANNVIVDNQTQMLREVFIDDITKDDLTGLYDIVYLWGKYLPNSNNVNDLRALFEVTNTYRVIP